MSWTRWRIGLIIAVLSGAFTGLIGLSIGMTGQQILVLLIVNVAKDGLLYLKDHPVDSIDTAPPFKPESKSQ